MSEPLWLLAARADIGQRESLGPNDSPWLRKVLGKLGAAWLLGQPWCGGAVAYWMEAVGIKPAKNWFRAKAWLDWGVPLNLPALGCVVVFERKGGGHVGLVVGETPDGRLMVLGGNQGDAVNVAPFYRGRVLGYRWPVEAVNRLGTQALPMFANAGASSSNEA
jgi:uncharacterized protein (TIGR02594 family)